jgi:hypothetical protein
MKMKVKNRMKLTMSLLTLVLFLLVTVTATFAWWNLLQKEKEVDIVIGNGDGVEILIDDPSNPVLGELVPNGERLHSNQVEEIVLEYKVKAGLKEGHDGDLVENLNLKLKVTSEVIIVDDNIDDSVKNYIKVEIESITPTDTITSKEDELIVTVRITLDVPEVAQTPEIANLLKNTNWKIKLVFELVKVQVD